MRLFHCVKASQLVCCFVVLCFVLSTTELRGRLVTRDGQNQTLLTRQLKSRGGSCDQLVFYLPTRHQQYLLQSTTTVANTNNIKHRGQRAVEPTAAAKEHDQQKQKQDEEDEDGDGPGRIVLVFDGSSVRTNEKLNTTDELRLHAYLLFEWNSNDGNGTEVSTPNGGNVKSQPGSAEEWLFLQANSTNKNNADGGKRATGEGGNGNVVGARDGNQTDDGVKRQHGDQSANGGGLLPEGEYAFKINKIDGVKNGHRSSSQLGMDEPFHGVAGRLFLFAITSIFQLIYTIAHVAVKGVVNKRNGANLIKNQLKGYSSCEMFFLLIGMVLWLTVVVFAAELWASWTGRWQCTNFRPELPIVFPLALILAIISLFLLVVETWSCVSDVIREEGGCHGRGRQRQQARVLPIPTVYNLKPVEEYFTIRALAKKTPRSRP